jgi:hypothetical protein
MVEQVKFILILLVFIICFVIIFSVIILLREPEFGKRAGDVLAAIVRPFSSIISELLSKAFDLIIWF